MIKLKADFYADTFRSCELEVDDYIEKFTDDQRRLLLSEIVAESLEKRGIKWDKKRQYSWYNHGANRDHLGIGFIICKRI